MRRYVPPLAVSGIRSNQSKLILGLTVVMMLLVVCTVLLNLAIGPFVAANPPTLARRGPIPKPPSTVPKLPKFTREQVFKAIDANKDGKLNFDEFIAGDALLYDDFMATDENQDGFVSKKEFKEYYKFLVHLRDEDKKKNGNKTYDLEKEDALFEKADKNKDGKISFNEFTKMDHQYLIGLINDFANYDDNSDDSLSQNEFNDFFDSLSQNAEDD